VFIQKGYTVMSSIVLSAAVRQNLLSLQSTADMLATTQNRLATGKKVNTALDNPTNYFTAQSLDARAGDINNLLDSIGNGVQVLQQANNGITSLQSLIDSAKSIAN
jgi:flagellin